MEITQIKKIMTYDFVIIEPILASVTLLWKFAKSSFKIALISQVILEKKILLIIFFYILIQH